MNHFRNQSGSKCKKYMSKFILIATRNYNIYKRYQPLKNQQFQEELKKTEFSNVNLKKYYKKKINKTQTSSPEERYEHKVYLNKHKPVNVIREMRAKQIK